MVTIISKEKKTFNNGKNLSQIGKDRKATEKIMLSPCLIIFYSPKLLID